MEHHISPTIHKLNSLPSNRNRRPQSANGKQPKLTKALAERFCDILAKTDKSLFDIIDQDPSLPHHKTLFNWQQRVPWFADMWKQARIRQTQFLAQLCLKLADSACPKTAHVVRVKFDIYKWYMAKYNPELFGDKPFQAPVQTVNIGFSLDPQRLSDLRAKLDSSRSAFLPVSKPSKRESVSGTHRKELINGNTPNGDADPGAEPGASKPDSTQ